MNCVFSDVKEKRWFVSTQSGGTGFNPGLKYIEKKTRGPLDKKKLCIQWVFQFFYEIVVLSS